MEGRGEGGKREECIEKRGMIRQGKERRKRWI